MMQLSRALLGVVRRSADADADLAQPSAVPGVRTVHEQRVRVRTDGLLLSGLVLLSLAVLLVGVLSRVEPLVVVSGLLFPVAVMRLLHLLWSAFPVQRDSISGQVQVVLLLVDALVAAAVLRSDAVRTTAAIALITSLVAVQVLRTALLLVNLADARQQANRIETRNLAVPALPERPLALRSGGQPAIVLTSALVPIGLGAALLFDASWAVSVAAALAVAALGLVLALSVPAVVAHARLVRGGRYVRSVHERAMEHAPLIVLYSAGDPDDLYWVTQWLDTLEHLSRRSLLMMRDPDAAALLPPTTVPVVCLPHYSNIGPFKLPSAKVALYVAHGTENARLLRSRTLRSAYIGHGDSDKGVSASPFCKSYDEVWVAGDVGRQRFIEADCGVRLDAVRLVGRPQVRLVQQATTRASGSGFTVLYAPSWEGVERRHDESSLLHSGKEIATRLLALPDVRVIYRPHPKTGERNPSFVSRHRDIVELIEAAGSPHRVDPPHSADLFEAFSETDVLIADLSGVLSDFLASGKPYVVVNASRDSDPVYRAAHRSLGGAYLVGVGGEGLEAALADARSGDSMAEPRRATRVALLGPAVDDPLAPFTEAVDALAATLPDPQ